MGQRIDNATATTARREIILRVVVHLNATLGRAAIISEVHNLLQKWVDDGVSWPEASWKYARNKPYQLGTGQHLEAMRHAGALEYGKDTDYRSYIAVGKQLRARAADAIKLQAEGKSRVEIAEELGISKSLVHSLVSDPTGEKEKERKRRYCPSCGTPKPPEAVTCLKCRQIELEELLPPDSYRYYIVQAREQGFDLVFGVTPELRRVIRVDVGRGFFDYEVRSDLTWRDGLGEVSGEIGVSFE